MIISEIQYKLATWTTADPTRRIDRLLRLIAHPVWLEEAARITLSSKGAHTPGTDGVRKQGFIGNLANELKVIREELLSGTYKPSPARRIYIPKANGKMRPLGIPTIKDRVVQRAMLMAMEPIWESDFHRLSYGFRPERSVHHAIRTIKIQMTDNPAGTKGRWVIEGDLSSYFDTVHHRILIKAIRKRICDKRFLTLLWDTMKAGHIDKGLFCAASEGVPQGGVISPLLSNIMLNEFDQYLEKKYLGNKARKDRWYQNHSIKIGRSSVEKNGWKWKPAVAYCRYADDFVVIIKGSKIQAELIREECKEVLEGKLKLTLNMEKTKITHANDGFVFLGHRLIRKRNKKGVMRITSTIPRKKSKDFAHNIAKTLSSGYGDNKIGVVKSLNKRLMGWKNFYQFIDQKAKVFNHIDSVAFWKLAYWLGRKYKRRMKPIMRLYFKRPTKEMAKTLVLAGRNERGIWETVHLKRLLGNGSKRFCWKIPKENPYMRREKRNTITSRYQDVAMALTSI